MQLLRCRTKMSGFLSLFSQEKLFFYSSRITSNLVFLKERCNEILLECFPLCTGVLALLWPRHRYSTLEHITTHTERLLCRGAIGKTKAVNFFMFLLRKASWRSGYRMAQSMGILLWRYSIEAHRLNTSTASALDLGSWQSTLRQTFG